MHSQSLLENVVACYGVGRRLQDVDMLTAQRMPVQFVASTLCKYRPVSSGVVNLAAKYSVENTTKTKGHVP